MKNIRLIAMNGGYRLRDAMALSLGADGAPPEWIHLVPYGMWQGHPMGPFAFGEMDAAQVIANFQAKSTDLVVDYEHQTLHAPYNGQPAPAAGWVDRMEARADGVWGHVKKWTSKAVAALKAEEYRYFSPVICFNHTDAKSGQNHGTYLHSGGLTNTPFLTELTPVVNADQPTPRESAMLTLLLSAFALPATATEADVKAASDNHKKIREAACKGAGLPIAASDTELLAALPTLENQARLGAAVCRELKLDPKAPPADAEARLCSELKHSGYVSLAEHAAALRDGGQKVQALSDQQLLEDARRKGLVTPAMEGWANSTIKKDRAGFEAWMAAAPASVPTTSPVTGPAPTPAAAVALSDSDRVAAKMMGLTDAEFLKGRK